MRPLNELLQGNFSTRRKHAYTSKTQSLVERWIQTCRTAFDIVVQKLTSAPVLGYADWKLHTFYTQMLVLTV